MVHWSAVLLSSGLLQGVCALPQVVPSSVTAPPSLTLSTVAASPTAPLSSTLPSQVTLPPKQAWCPSRIFCAGEVRTLTSMAEYKPYGTCVLQAPSNSERRSSVRRPEDICGQTHSQVLTGRALSI